MKPSAFHLILAVPALVIACALPATAGDVILADNFDAPDIGNFDNSDQTGRRSGLLAADVQLRSARRQHTIIGNQLDLGPPAGGSGRVRFHNANDLNLWWDFSSGAVGAQIATEGGMRVEFDWTPPDITGTQWVSFNLGVNAPETPVRVNHAETDVGILFRNNGDTEHFDNGTNLGPGGSFTATLAPRHVVVDYAFTSWADEAGIVVTASVDGTTVLENVVFAFDNNADGVFFEFGANLAGNLIDNFSMSTLLPDDFGMFIAGTRFYSSAPAGTAIGTLTSFFDSTEEAATYSFVAGEGDADNDKFRLNGNTIEVGSSFDFLNEADGTGYSVRILATGDVSGGTGSQSFTLKLTADSDSDTLPDVWELSKTDDLLNLNGLGTGPGPGAGTGDFDGDTLSDLEEWQLDTSTFPGLDPTLADTDGDELEDAAELAGVDSRPATDPTRADTDGDSLDDKQESNSGIFADADDTGSNPTLADTDGDEFQDGFEFLRGGSPVDGASIPPLSSGISLAMLTDDASSEIDSTKTYTHAISGGGAATVNGVLLEEFNPATIPAGFAWDTGEFTMAQIVSPTNGDWDSAAGGVIGTGLLELLGGFTYSGSGAAPGAAQEYTLSGLTEGQSYSLRLYVRLWDTDGSGRPADISFSHGATVAYAPILEDRPARVLGDPAATHAAYMIRYDYIAGAADLVIRAEVPVGALNPSGSYHMFGLTNESGGAPPLPVITNISYDSTVPSATITFDSIPGVNYSLDFSTALKEVGTTGGWGELIETIPSQGTSTTYIDAEVPAVFQRAFYRLRIEGN